MLSVMNKPSMPIPNNTLATEATRCAVYRAATYPTNGTQSSVPMEPTNKTLPASASVPPRSATYSGTTNVAP